MRRLLLSLLLVSGAALAADDLVEANRLLAAKEYGKAMSLFTRLANAGNSDAQLRLGEMYWFGEGATQDLDTARRWFEKAAAAGNAGGKDSLAALDRRKVRGSEIVYWTQQYDGADLRSGKFACPLPAIPAASTTNADIKATKDAIEGWRSCHQGFMANFNATVSSGKHIPAEVLDMMTPAETDRALAHVQSVYAKVKDQASADIATMADKQTAWYTATDGFVKEENKRLARQQKEETDRIVDAQRRMSDNSAMQRMERMPPMPSPMPSRPSK